MTLQAAAQSFGLGLRCPALFLPDDTWQSAAQELISQASLIVMEVSLASGWSKWELEQCKALGREHRTILVHGELLDEPNTLSMFDGFNRVIFSSDLGRISFSSHPAARDICDQILGVKLEDEVADRANLQRIIQTDYGIGVIPDLSRHATQLMKEGDIRRAASYFAMAIGIAARVVQCRAGFSPDERKFLVVAAMDCGECLFRIGNLEQALQHVETALSLVKDFKLKVDLSSMHALRSEILNSRDSTTEPP